MSPRPEGVFLARAIPPKPAQGAHPDYLVCPLCGLLYRRTPVDVPDGACRWCGAPQSEAASDVPRPGSPTPPPIPGVGPPNPPAQSPDQGPNHNNREERP